MATTVIRSAIKAGARSISSRSRTSPSSLTPTPQRLINSPFSHPSSSRALPVASRLSSALGIVESLKPLHSAIASARLTSVLALDTACWSCLSQGFTLTL